MEWLNYHHLLYFWTVVREGGIKPASARLRLAHPTVSAQVHALEAALGERLFQKDGRRLVLTELGKVVYGYADEIFALGRELLDTVKGRSPGRPRRLAVGVVDVLPKLLVHRLLAPAWSGREEVQLVVKEDRPERLFAELALHNLDLVLAEEPLPAGSGVRAFSHLLGECGLAFFAKRSLARKLAAGFPGSLDGAPFLLPAEGSALRRSLDGWFDRHGIRPRLVAELEDSALLKVFGADGRGVFGLHAVTAEAVVQQYGVELVGASDEARARVYAISGERRLKHPAVVAISEGAKEELFRCG